jgi:kynurenine formamidase
MKSHQKLKISINTNKLAGFTACLCLALPVMAEEDKWWPSRWGANDRMGSMNLLTPEKAIEAAKLVKTGKSYALAIDSGPETPAGAGLTPRSFALSVVQPNNLLGKTVGKNGFSFNDDFVNAWLGVGTQIDGLGHVGIHNRYYNGVKAEDFITYTGLKDFALHKMPPITTRGVLLDIAAYKNKVFMEAGEVITVADIKGAAKAQGVSIGEGDIVLFNTGWMKAKLKSDPNLFNYKEPGLGVAGARYLIDLGVVAIGEDSFGLEAVPGEDPDILFPVHQLMLVKHGVYVLENIRTEELVADKAWEFMLVIGIPKYVGAVQALINPIAIR